MENKAKVSVIIPIYNVEKYLGQCLDSVLNQTLEEIEIICIEAGSTDGSADILKQYQLIDTRVSVIHSSRRLDAGSARNIGLEKATGEYLAILDSDDYFGEDMLEEAYQRAVKSDADIVVFYAKQHDMKTNKVSFMPWSMRTERCPSKQVFSPEDMPDLIFNCFQNWTWNKLFKTSFIKENNIVFQPIARTNDMAFTCQALAMARRISLLKKAYPVYRVGTQTSLQDTNHLAPTAFWSAYKETQKRLKEYFVYDKYEHSFKNAVLSGLLHNLDSVKSEKAHDEILELIRSQGEMEFGIGSHARNYYYNPVKYDRYMDIVRGKCDEKFVRADERSRISEIMKDKIKSLTQNRAAYAVYAIWLKVVRRG